MSALRERSAFKRLQLNGKDLDMDLDNWIECNEYEF